MNFEIDVIRESIELMFDLKGIDSKLKFYYDETNNIRKYYLKEDKFNESIKTNFILGGLVLEENQELDIQPLFNSFGLQKTVAEVKLKNIAKGDFIECLKSVHLQSIFKYLLENEISIHYSSLNFLYFSVVDIIDSLIEATNIHYNPFYNRALKNDLYICVKNNIEIFIEIFFRYQYPNIKEDSVLAFIDELIEIFNKEPKNVGNRTILMLLNESKKTGNLVFIMNEENHQLIGDFTNFYSRTIYLFLNSEHFFDKEDSIEPLLNDLNMTYNKDKIENFIFIDSKTNLYIQLSDIIIGFIGKFFNFINENNINSISEFLEEVDDNQQQTLKLFYKVLEKSELKNKAYIHLTISNDEHEKINYIKNYP